MPVKDGTLLEDWIDARRALLNLQSLDPNNWIDELRFKAVFDANMACV